MASSKTVGFDQLKALYAKITPAIHASSAPELSAQADELVSAQKAKVHVRSGKTKESIRKVAGKDDLEIYVIAGGEMTTKAIGGRAGAYDYAVGEEFGNEHSPAQPFFYGPYRQKRKAFKRRQIEAAMQAVAEVVE